MAGMCAAISDEASFVAGTAERQFLNMLMGGCSVPISAYASIDGDSMEFTGAVHSFDGSQSFIINKIYGKSDWPVAGREAATELLAQDGAEKLLEEIRTKKWNNEDTID